MHPFMDMGIKQTTKWLMMIDICDEKRKSKYTPSQLTYIQRVVLYRSKDTGPDLA